MNCTKSNCWKHCRWPLGLGLALGVGYLAGIASQPTANLRADVTEEARREAFKAGGERVEPITREIAGTLKRIEGRLERMEKLMSAKQKN